MQDKPKRNHLMDDVLEKPSSRISGAVVLIALGVIFLLTQNNLLRLSGNWWALFIFIPAAVMLYNAYTAYNRDKYVTPVVRSQLSGGVIVLTVAVIAATGQWGTLWPLFLIVPGVLLLLVRDKQKE
jgi:drug/metabolite transporter (DMT)-like permease